ncbi:hypothetical protein ACTVZO_43940 [Streptomyces sp. IBSNAI002]|uniref:hypothetical protein n=1 Tax=Streptomyces sp. IBSNAI002 TaxID=3457500 RepID=UPI003FCFD32F
MTVKHRHALISSVGVILAAGSVALATPGFAMAAGTPAPGPAKPETKAGAEPIYTLGYSNRPNSMDSEFRYDGIVAAPKGVGIKAIRYAYNGDGNARTTAKEVSRGRGGVGEEYEVVSTKTEGDNSKITFTLRGDFGPGGKAPYCPTTEYPVRVEVDLTDGTKQVVEPKMDMRRFDRCDGQSGTEGGRPVVRLPWDNAWRSPDGNSADGWGFITDTGKVPGNKFIIDASNPRHGTNLPCNRTDSVYYQWVKSDGTASQLTPEPVKLNVTPHGNDWSKKIEFTGTTDFTKDGPGYYKLLAWPQADSTGGQVCQASWKAGDASQAFQVGSVFYGQADELDTPLTSPAVMGTVGLATAAVAAGGGVWLTRRRRSHTTA